MNLGIPHSFLCDVLFNHENSLSDHDYCECLSTSLNKIHSLPMAEVIHGNKKPIKKQCFFFVLQMLYMYFNETTVFFCFRSVFL